MVNEKSLKNLKSNTERTPKQRKELARKAGIKSGVIRKEKANFKYILKKMLENKATKPLLTVLNNYGIKTSKNQTILESLIQLATVKAMAENTNLAQLIRFLEFAKDTLEEKNEENTTLTPVIISKQTLNSVIEKLKEL